LFTNGEIYLVWVWPVFNGNDIILKINGYNNNGQGTMKMRSRPGDFENEIKFR
jgi:hypothetical protein